MKSIYICLENLDTLTGEQTIAFSDVISIHCNHKVLRVYRLIPEEDNTITDTYEMSKVLYYDAE